MATPSPKELILTVYGAFARRVDPDGWLAIADLVALMRPLEVDGAAVRQAVSRMKRRHLLASGSRGRAVGYAPSPSLAAVLREGDRRIFATREPASLGDGWTVAVYSVPETDRHLRHVLRSRLSSLGFGNLAAGVWVAPRRDSATVAAALAEAGLTAYVDLFSATYDGFGDVRALAARCWDLDALSAAYSEFLAECEPVLKRWRRVHRTGGSAGNGGGDTGESSGTETEQAYADYVSALTLWRRLPYRDPGLPADVLPAAWAGRQASDVFHELFDLLEGPAYSYVTATLARRP